MNEGAAIRQGVTPVGATPTERLRWLLEEFLYEDYSKADDETLAGLWLRLQGFVLEATSDAWSLSPPAWQPVEQMARSERDRAYRWPTHQRDLALALDKKAKRASLVMERGRQPLPGPEVILTQGQLRRIFLEWAAGRGVKYDLKVYFFTCPGFQLFISGLGSGLFVAAGQLVAGLQRGRLRRCAFTPPGQAEPCIRVFVARKSQLYCSPHGPLVRQEQLRRAQQAQRRRRLDTRSKDGTTSMSGETASPAAGSSLYQYPGRPPAAGLTGAAVMNPSPGMSPF